MNVKAALYLRISTQEGKQFSQNQRAEILQFIERRGWTVAREFSDEASGGKAGRAGLEALLSAAHKGEFDCVVVWALDRFTREGIYKAFQYLERLAASRVQFYSVTEPQFCTGGPFGEFMIAMAAWMAKQERERIRERVNAGLQRAKEAGRTFGRPKRVFDIQTARDAIAGGLSVNQVAADLGVPRATLQRRLRA